MRNANPGTVRAVVTIVPAEVAPLAVGVTDAGFSEHDDPDGTPVHVSATGVVYPFTPTTATPKLAVPPAATETEDGAATIVKSGDVVVPVPNSVAVCGLFASLAATFKVAGVPPDTVGVKVTSIVQLAPDGNEVPHVVVFA
jgi:hypothetical protein